MNVCNGEGPFTLRRRLTHIGNCVLAGLSSGSCQGNANDTLDPSG